MKKLKKKEIELKNVSSVESKRNIVAQDAEIGEPLVIKDFQSVEIGIENFSYEPNESEVLRLTNCSSLLETFAAISERLEQLHPLAIEALFTHKIKEINFEIFTQIQNIFNHQKLSYLFIDSKDTNSTKFLFWKHQGQPQIFVMRFNEDEETKISFYVRKFLLTSLTSGHNGLLPSCKYERTNAKIELEIFSLGDHRGFNLLSIASENGNVEAVKTLLKLGFDVHISVDGVKAMDLAYNHKNFDVILELLKHHSLYPENFSTNGISHELKTFISISKSMHESIQNKKEEKVLEILNANPSMKFFYDFDNNSALTYAIINSSFKIYEIFMLRNMCFGPFEDIEDLLDFVDKKTQKNLKRIHSKHSKGLIKKHLMILLANTSVGHDDDNEAEKIAAVTLAYQTLDKNQVLSQIMKVVAASRNFKITFDFKRESVRFLDPSIEGYASGLFSTSGKILIGAQDLLNDHKKHVVFGVIAHELSHFAIFEAFQNSAKPYAEGDTKNEKLFQGIIADCKSKKDSEEIVDLAFDCYPPKLLPAEVIVRYPHILGHYHNQQNEIDDKSITFGPLKAFYEAKVMPALDDAIKRLEEKADIKGKYLKTKKELKVMRISIFVLILLMIVGGPLIYFFAHGPTKVWRDLSFDEREIVKNNFVEYFGVKVKLKNLFDDNSTAFDDFSPQQLAMGLDNDAKGLNEAFKSFLFHKVALTWENCTKDLREKIMNGSVDFQGENVTLKDVLSFDSKVLYELNVREIKNLIRGKSLKVGGKYVVDDKFFIERRFKVISTVLSSQVLSILDNVLKKDPSKSKNLNSDNKVKNVQGVKDLDLNSNPSLSPLGNFSAKVDDQSILTSSKEMPESSMKTKDNDILKKNDSIPQNTPKKFFTKRDIDSYDMQSNDDDSPSTECDINFVIDLAINEEVSLLVDGPGSGKSTMLKHLTESFKKVHKNYWVAFVSLKDYEEVYEDLIKNQVQNFQDVIATKILKLEGLDLSIFKELFSNGRVAIFWDAFDEVNIKFHPILLNIFNSIKTQSQIIQFISSRPEYQKGINEALPANIYNLIPFDLKDREIFFNNQLKNISNGDKIKRKIQKFIEQTEDKKLSDETINNPLMLQIIADVLKRDQNLNLKNRFEIYQKFVEGQIDSVDVSRLKFFTKQPLSVYDIHKIYAIKLLYSVIFEYDPSFKNLELLQNEIYLTPAEVASFGLMTLSEDEKLNFIHKSFAEFFVAYFLVDKVFNMTDTITKEEMDTRIGMVASLPKNPLLDGAERFLYEYLRNFHEIYDWKEKNLRTAREIFNQTESWFNANVNNFSEEIGEIERRLLMKDFESFEKILIKGFDDVHQWMRKKFEISQNSLENHEIGNIFYKVWHHFNVGEFSLSYLINKFTNLNLDKETLETIGNNENFPNFYNFISKNLTDKEKSKMLQKNFAQIFLTHFKSPESYLNLWHDFTNSTGEKEIAKNLFDENQNGENIFHFITKFSDSKVVQLMLDEIEKYLNKRNESFPAQMQFPTSYACKNDIEVLKIYWKFVKKYSKNLKFNLFCDFEEVSVIFQNGEIFDGVHNFYEFFSNFIESKLNSTQSLKVYEAHEFYALKVMLEKFPFLANLSILSSEVSHTSDEIVSYGFMTQSDGELKFHDKIFLEFFITRTIIRQVFNMTEKIGQDEMILRILMFLYSGPAYKNVKQFLFEYLKENHEIKDWSEENLKTARKIILQNSDRVNWMLKACSRVGCEVLRRFLMKDFEGCQKFMTKGYENVFEWLRLKIGIQVEDREELLRVSNDSEMVLKVYQKNHQIGNIFYKIWYHYQYGETSLSFLINKFTGLNLSEEYLEKVSHQEKFSDFYALIDENLTAEDEVKMFEINFSKIFLNCWKSDENYYETWLKFVNIMKGTNVENLLKIKNKNGENILHIIAKMSDPKIVELMLNEIAKYLDQIDIKQLINSWNKLKETPTFLACNNNQNAVEVFWKFIKKYLSEEEQKIRLICKVPGLRT